MPDWGSNLCYFGIVLLSIKMRDKVINNWFISEIAFISLRMPGDAGQELRFPSYLFPGGVLVRGRPFRPVLALHLSNQRRGDQQLHSGWSCFKPPSDLEFSDFRNLIIISFIHFIDTPTTVISDSWIFFRRGAPARVPARFALPPPSSRCSIWGDASSWILVSPVPPWESYLLSSAFFFTKSIRMVSRFPTEEFETGVRVVVYKILLF